MAARKGLAEETAQLRAELDVLRRERDHAQQLLAAQPAPAKPEPVTVSAVLDKLGLFPLLRKLLPEVDKALDGGLEQEHRVALDHVRTGIRGLL